MWGPRSMGLRPWLHPVAALRLNAMAPRCGEIRWNRDEMQCRRVAAEYAVAWAQCDVAALRLNGMHLLDNLLFEYVKWIINNLMTFQHRNKFFFESSLSMMLFLVEDVGMDHILLRLAY